MVVGETLYLLGLAGVAVVAYFIFGSFAFGAGYQPTPREAVLAMLDLARVGPTDTLYDLGAGTGAIVFRAAEAHGARVVAVEVEPLRVAVLHLRRWLSPARSRIEIRWGNLFHLDLAPATVVALFLWPGAMERLRPAMEASLTRGARVVSHWHPVLEWTADRTDPVHRVYLYER